MLLMTRVWCRNRKELWNKRPSYKYIPANEFGMTGMTYNRWIELWHCIYFSYQPPCRPHSMGPAAYGWMLVNDFVKNFNDYRERTFSPSDMICVDESISRWYGLGGHWINLGLPMYVAIDRKPKKDCKIQDSCEGRARIMLRLKLVMHKEDETIFLEY